LAAASPGLVADTAADVGPVTSRQVVYEAERVILA
jgi:hypothetical protein